MKFRFETVLKLRSGEEDLLQRELGRINSHLQAQRDRSRFMEDVALSNKLELNRKMKEGIDVNTMILYNNFFNGVKLQGKKQQTIVSEIESKMDAKRKELIEARRKRRTMEILKEKDFAEWKKKQDKIELGLMDETASNQWRMKSWK